MPDKPKKDALALADKTARTPRGYNRSGLYSWINSKRLPGGKGFQKTRRELAAMREQMIREKGGPEAITAGELVLIDSVVEALGVQKILGLYVRKYGVMDSRAAKRGSLELSPVLSRNWISYGNTVRQGLLALEELRKGRPKSDDLGALRAHIAGQDSDGAPVYEVPEAPEKVPGRPLDGRIEPGPSDEKGEE